VITISSKNGFVLLPNPSFDNTEARDTAVDYKRAMDGTRYTHIKTSDAKRITYSFSMDRPKAHELQAFLKINKAELITVSGLVTITGYLEDATDNFVATQRASSDAQRGEFGSYTLTIVGE